MKSCSFSYQPSLRLIRRSVKFHQLPLSHRTDPRIAPRYPSKPPAMVIRLVSTASHPHANLVTPSRTGQSSNTMARQTHASAPFIPESAAGKPINLLRGWPAPALLPPAALSAALTQALSDPSVAVPGLQYGPDSGFAPLRNELASLLSSFYGVVSPPDPERICITGGASQSLANILASFTDARYTRAVWMVAPCYFLACPIFEDAGFGGRLKAVREDEDGIDLEVLESRLKAANEEWENEGREPDEKDIKHPANRKLYRHVVYLVPTCANPSGKTMPLARREALVRLARKYDALLIADDVYDLLQWPSFPASTTSADPLPFPPRDPNLRIPRLTDVDLQLGPAPNDPHHFGHTVSNGSFSKIVAPGVRTGWVEASPAFAHGIAQTGATKSGGSPSHVAALMMWELLRSGELQHRLQYETVPALRDRHQRAMRAVDELLVPLGVTVRRSSLREAEGHGVYGGYFIWLTMPEGVSGSVVAARAREKEALVVGDGAQFEVHGDEDAARFESEVRICFSWEDVEDIVEGITRLARALEDVREGKFTKDGLKGTGNVQNDK